VTESYFLPSGYESRLEPEYFVDEELNAVWQPDLYPEAATVARRLGSRRIIDVGCGTAEKLARLHPEFEVVGIDFGSNIAASTRVMTSATTTLPAPRSCAAT
jgi:2-polyprenyl-3-methyl-5-hydroxy-6-metoxy-1,4-benzoquinol methylase